MWDSLCAENSGNFNAWWQANTFTHNYAYVPCDSNGNVTVGIIIQNGSDTNGRVCRDTAFYRHQLRFGLIDPRFTSTYDPKVQYCKNSTFDFMLNDSTLDSIVYINWNYGDGVNESNLSLGKRTHTYKKRGRYSVVLTLRHANGCVAIDSMVIRIGAQASLLFDKHKICLSDSVKVTNTTNYWNGPAHWKNPLRDANNKETTRWDLGDGNGFSKTNYQTYFKYNKIGNYAIKMEYTDSVGCVDTFNYALPIRVFDVFSNITLPSKQLVCAQVFQFKSSASVYDSLNSFGHKDDSIKTHVWYFDQASSSSLLKNPFKFFRDGWHDVELLVTNTLGCKDSKKDTFFISGPVADFEMLSDTIGCMPLTVTFKNKSTNANSYTWLYKNPANNISISNSNANVNFTYTDYGIYRPQLIARKTFLNNGISVTCADTFVVNPLTKYSPKIEVYELPKPNFTHSTNCATYTTTFTNTSKITTGTIVKYSWSFGDGNSSTLKNPVHQFADSGKYNIRLKAYSQYGCVDSMVRTIFVYPLPEADFTFNEVCQGKATNFKDLTKAFNDIITNYTWNFGNGVNNSSKNPNYIYPKDSVFYTVKLTVRNRSGCSDVVSKQVRVWAKPKSNFTAVNVCLKNTINFTNTGSSKQAVQSNAWTMGDGTNLQSNAFSKTYADTGKYIVKLKTTSVQGCADSVSKQIQIYANPKANFNSNSTSQCLNQNRFVLSNSSVMYSGTITAYEWRLSTGFVSSRANIIYSFPSVDTYAIKLIARSNNFCYDTIVKIVYVRPSPKSIIQLSAFENCINTADSIALKDVSTIDTSIRSRIWTLDLGVTNTQKQFKYKYNTVGSRSVSLRVQNSVNCWDTSYKTIAIHPKPQAIISQQIKEQCFRNNLFTYKDSSKISNPYTSSVTWYFGDGDTSISAVTTHRYLSFDTFNVKLIAVSDKACKDTANQILVVHPMPISAFKIDTLKQCLKANQFNFTNRSSISHGSISYAWQFGDANASTLKNPAHAYLNFGSYTCSLFVQSNFGCKDSSYQKVQVFSMPVANFKWVDSTACFRSNKMIAITTSTIPQGTYTTYWRSMVKQLIGKDTFAVQWPKDSTYAVVLKLVSNAGCTDSIRKNAYVWPMPVALFKIDSAKQCLRSNLFKYRNYSAAKDGQLRYQVPWQWLHCQPKRYANELCKSRILYRAINCKFG
jgi:PKD repeat protein